MCSITYSNVSEHLIWWPGGEEGMAVSKAQLVRCPGWHFVPTYLGQQMSHLICWPGYEGTKCQPGHLTNYALRISNPPSPPGHQMSCCISWLFRVSYYKGDPIILLPSTSVSRTTCLLQFHIYYSCIVYELQKISLKNIDGTGSMVTLIYLSLYL